MLLCPQRPDGHGGNRCSECNASTSHPGRRPETPHLWPQKSMPCYSCYWCKTCAKLVSSILINTYLSFGAPVSLDPHILLTCNRLHHSFSAQLFWRTSALFVLTKVLTEVLTSPCYRPCFLMCATC